MSADAAAKRAELIAARKAGQQSTAFGEAARLAEAVEWMRANTWSDFYASVLSQFDQRGELSEKQVDAVLRGKVKQLAKRAAKPAAAIAIAVDVAELAAMFARVAESLKFPKLVFDGIALSLAGANSKNAGSIYVKAGREYEADYYGKITGGIFVPVSGCPDHVGPRLVEISANPAEQFRLSGIETGECCCCGRELTNPESIAAGIGPICAGRWFG